jgi:hypothetical protein
MKPRFSPTDAFMALWHSAPVRGAEVLGVEFVRRSQAAGGTAPDPELLDLGAAAEGDDHAWRAEFAWLLRHPAVTPVLESPEPGAPLTLRTIAGQHAARFPIVSGDVDWLRERSMAVVARRLAPHLAAGAQASLDVSALARGEAPPALRREQMQLVAAGMRAALPGALARYGIGTRGLVLSVGADHPGIGALLGLRECAALGRPRVVVRVPDSLMQALGRHDAPEGDGAVRLWHGLTALAHREPGIRLVLERTTRPACALAWGERADAVLPVSRFEARAETAWLALGLRLDALAVPACLGDGLRELRRLLRAALRLADDVVEQVDWATPELAQDALVNRRLAVHVTGIGDLVDRWRLDPAAFGTVKLAVRWLALVRRLMVRESNALARERGPFPGLELRELARSLAHNVGEERAGRLLRQAGLRHRHLLVLSPYSVFPERAPRQPLAAYLHLLPSIRAADTIAMHGDGVARALSPAAFRRLLQMTWAIGRNRP